MKLALTDVPVVAAAGCDLLPWPLKIRSKRSQPAAAPTGIGVFLSFVDTTKTCESLPASDGGGSVTIHAKWQTVFASKLAPTVISIVIGIYERYRSSVGASLLAKAVDQAAKKTAPYGAVCFHTSTITCAHPPTISAVRCSSRSRPSASRWPVSVLVRPAGRTSIARRVPGSFSVRTWLAPWSVPDAS